MYSRVYTSIRPNYEQEQCILMTINFVFAKDMATALYGSNKSY